MVKLTHDVCPLHWTHSALRKHNAQSLFKNNGKNLIKNTMI